MQLLYTYPQNLQKKLMVKNIKPATSYKEAIQSLTTAIKWYGGQDEVRTA